MDLGLKGKVAIITGAGGHIGFGRVIALRLAREGCKVVITYNRNAEGAKAVANEINSLGCEVLSCKTDIRVASDVNNMVEASLQKFGKIDILVNNAGGPANPPMPFIETKESYWDMDIDLNLKGTLHCTRAVLKCMVSRKEGKIINISSMSARTGAKYVTVYESAKAAVISFTKSLALEVACYGINVNCVAPGFGMTELGLNVSEEILNSVLKTIPLKRTTTPEDVSYAVAYFASNISSDVTGQTLAVDGGTTMY